MSRSPVNRRDPTGTKKVERQTIERMGVLIDSYTEAMTRVATGVEEGVNVAIDTDREYKLMRLRQAMEADLQVITETWIEDTKKVTIQATDRVLNNMHVGIKLGDVPIPREEATMLAIGIETNVRTVAEDLLKDISRITIEGYQDGLGAEQIARNIRDDSLTLKWNAERMVRTETMRVRDVVAKVRYEAAGCDGYMSYPTEDDRLCMKCLGYATGGSGTTLKIYGLTEPMALPWHPNCRCCRIPHFADQEAIEI